MWKLENAMGITTVWYSEAEYNRLKEENEELKEKLVKYENELWNS